jgi:hypothetical protein
MEAEVCDADGEGVRLKTPKTDIFSFGLILFEIVAILEVFPLSMEWMRRSDGT